MMRWSAIAIFANSLTNALFAATYSLHAIDFLSPLVYPPRSLLKCLFAFGNKDLLCKYSISNKTTVADGQR